MATNRSAAAKKAWKTRRKLYGKSGRANGTPGVRKGSKSKSKTRSTKSKAEARSARERKKGPMANMSKMTLKDRQEHRAMLIRSMKRHDRKMKRK